MGSRIKEEQLRVKTLLSDTVSLLCKNGLSFKKNLKVQGLLGITVDDDEVFIVHLNETMGDLVSASDPDQTELRTPSKNSESGRRSPKRKRRRRSTDSNLSHGQSDNTQDQSDSVIDLDPDIVIKDDPDAIVLDEVKFEGNSSRRSCEFADEGLSHAIGSISSFSPGYTPGSGDTTGRPNQRGPDRFHPQRSSSHNTGGPLTTATSTSQPPYITGMMPNVADSDQSSASTSYPPWDGGHDNHGNIGQNLPGVSNWASQVTQQTMSQPPNMSQQPGPSQGYSPGQRTGTMLNIPRRASNLDLPWNLPSTQGNPDFAEFGEGDDWKSKFVSVVAETPIPQLHMFARIVTSDKTDYIAFAVERAQRALGTRNLRHFLSRVPGLVRNRSWFMNDDENTLFIRQKGICVQGVAKQKWCWGIPPQWIPMLRKTHYNKLAISGRQYNRLVQSQQAEQAYQAELVEQINQLEQAEQADLSEQADGGETLKKENEDGEG